MPKLELNESPYGLEGVSEARMPEYMEAAESAHMQESAYLHGLGSEPFVFDHYPQIYLSSSPSDGNAPLSHDTSIEAAGFYYGYDPMLSFQPMDAGLGGFSAQVMGPPRIVLSRDSSFFDDWTANNSAGSSTNKLQTLAISLPTESDTETPATEKAASTSPISPTSSEETATSAATATTLS